ncbi:MAG: hypothetical protein VX367_08665, partial [SAR324 cluster bacterium]|nr:hypothetical protein [SAR324 cluster bacterium]
HVGHVADQLVDQISAITKVEPCHMANKCLLEMAATCAHVRIQELSFAHPTHADQLVDQWVDQVQDQMDAVTKVEPCTLANKYPQEMVATCVNVKDQAKFLAPQTHAGQVADQVLDQNSAITKVEPCHMANKYPLQMDATCVHVRIQELSSAHQTHADLLEDQWVDQVLNQVDQVLDRVDQVLDQMDAVTKVEPYHMAKEFLLVIIATCVHASKVAKSHAGTEYVEEEDALRRFV